MKALIFGFALLAITAPARAQSIETYHGTCDASAAVALGAHHFIVANDEDNVLRVYRFGEPKVAAQVPLDDFAKPDPRRPEMDIEAAAVIGTRIYWITSHGANSKGKFRESRHRLFATDMRKSGDVPTVVPVGMPYRSLLKDLSRAPALARYQLDSAAEIAPKEPGGLNIEGLAATPDGTLLLGFRGPQPEGRALVAEITNPAAVIERGEQARIGKVSEIDMGGRGIRAIETRATDTLIVAGGHGDQKRFTLYAWTSGANARALSVKVPADFQPEALMQTPGGKTYMVSDDGTRGIGGRVCKNLPAEERRFRMLQITP